MTSIFTEILQGQKPGYVIWQDEHSFALLADYPVNPGHIIVVPKEETDSWDNLSTNSSAELFRSCSVLSKAVGKAYPCEKVAMLIIGIETRHAHVHLIPIDSFDDVDFKATIVASEASQIDAKRKIELALNEILLANSSERIDA